MKTSTKGFSQEKKVELRDILCRECEKSWGTNGYKKTKIATLASKAAISTGSFYLLYDSKEDLFIATLNKIQDRLKSTWRAILTSEPSKIGLIEAMKFLFKEYKKSPFLYDFSNPDFLSFVSKLSSNFITDFRINNLIFFEEALEIAHLKLKIGKNKAVEIIQTLLTLTIISIRDRITNDFESVFEFILKATIDNVIE
ncbi:TetR/AcrR family transcriptional regulator [Enterococcus sp. LJL99]